MASTETNTSSNAFNMQSTQIGLNSNNDSNAHRPYFLSSSENSGNILVTQPLLRMKNYHSWSKAMVLALTAKKEDWLCEWEDSNERS